MTFVVYSFYQKLTIICKSHKGFSVKNGSANTVNSKTKQFLCLAYLIGVTSSVNSIPMYKVAEVDESKLIESTCTVDSHQIPATALVAFVHGGVFDQKGHPIKAGSKLVAEDVVTVQSDGFLALHISNNRTVNIQPDTLTSIACALAKQPGAREVTQPYRVGAIRG